MKKVILLAALSLLSSAALAESSTGTVSALHVHDHFSMLEIRGQTAQVTYDRLQTPETEDVNGSGQKMGSFSKISVDGRLWCQKIPQGASNYTVSAQGTFECRVTFDTSTGAINQTFHN